MKVWYVHFRDNRSSGTAIIYARTQHAAVNKWRRQYKGAQLMGVEQGI